MRPVGSTRLAALKTGFGVPDADFDAAVHSVFTNALILAVDGGGLVTLVPEEAGALPGGITLDAEAGIGFDRMIPAGARTAARAGVLRVADSGLTVDLRQAGAWRSRLGELTLDLARASSRKAWDTAAAMLATDGRAERFLRIAAKPVLALADAARGFRDAEASALMERLGGLGEGGTPAGDDFLVGFAAALHMSAAGDGRRRGFAEAFFGHLQSLADRTNAVSRVYLQAAAAGEVSEKLTNLALRIARGDAPAPVEEAAASAIAVGHTSGADGTLGLLAGMAASGPDADRAIERLAAGFPAPVS
jgi:hypothetical protein